MMTKSGKDIHFSHSCILIISILFSWGLWVFVNFSAYREVHGHSLMLLLIKDFCENLVEITILLEISLLYVKKVSVFFWRHRISATTLLTQVLILALLNGILSVSAASVYSVMYPNDANLFMKIALCDYINLSVLTTAYMVVFLLNQYHSEERALLESQLKALSLKVDNHFIFNSLSTLSALIETDTKQSLSFLNSFTKIYRYLVSTGNKNYVRISDEISFSKEYSNTILSRFSNVKVLIDQNIAEINGYLFPVSVQLLLENAIKHNIHDKDEPLVITIQKDDNYIVVRNNYQPRLDNYQKTGTGLNTLRERYLLFLKRDIIVGQNDNYFEVKLPIISEKDVQSLYENINY